MEQVLEILKKIKPTVDFEKEQNLFEDHILASLEIIMLVSSLNEEFDIEIRLPDLKPENFKSAETIYALVERLIEEE